MTDTPRQVDPADLTPAQLKALRIVKTYRLRPVTNGWRAPGSPFVSRNMVAKLARLQLVAARYRVNIGRRLEITGAGNNTLIVADARSERKSA